MTLTIPDRTERITLARELSQRGDLTQQQIADQLGVRDSTISKWLHPDEAKECLRCDAVLRTPARNCGMCLAEILEETIRDLAEPPPACTFAVFELRDQGLNARQVRCIQREVKRGRKPYEVVTVLEGLKGWRAAG
jgi:predicted transcriptional regulator